MASWRLRSARPAALLVAAVLVVLVTGCATAPSGGAPQRLEGQSGQQQAYVQPLPPPAPRPYSWSATDVVLAFLAASANFELDPSAARRYLAPHVPLPWDAVPGQPPVVTVVNTHFLSTQIMGQHLTGGLPTETVTVRGERLASLSSRGDYLYQPGTESYTFQLGDYNGTWLIQQLPPSEPGQNQLLVTQPAFEEVFQPRNLYLFGPQSGESENYLVPDPVFVPLDAAATDATSLATELVQGLLVVPNSQATWLSTATYTAFPEGTTLAQHGVTISNMTARVSLEVPGASTPAELSQMYAELYETLTSSAYSVPAIVHNVQLVVNGKREDVGKGSAFVPAVGSTSASADVDSLYYATPDQVDDLIPAGTPGTAAKVMTPDVLSLRSAITAIAVSPGKNPELAVAVRDLNGCEVFVGRAGQATKFTSWPMTTTGGACRSLSWDSLGDLWMVVGSDIWVSQQNHDPVQVDPPTNEQITRVLALRVAPDGVRVALLVATKHGNKMLLAAVTYSTGNVGFESGRPVGTDVANPTAISWYKPDYLLALAGSKLYQVPLTGGTSQFLTPVPGGTVAISAAESNALAVRTAAGQIYTSLTPGDGWTPGIPGASVPGAEAGPDYPG
jgi:Lipoprotein LpqB beta-propeller domain/Sporulation and spore germination